jgi:hypothetical protein
MRKLLLSVAFTFIFLLCCDSRLYGSSSALGSLQTERDATTALSSNSEQKGASDSLQMQLFEKINEGMSQMSKELKKLLFPLYVILVILLVRLLFQFYRIIQKTRKSQEGSKDNQINKIKSILEELKQTVWRIEKKPDVSDTISDNIEVLKQSLEKIYDLLNQNVENINNCQTQPQNTLSIESNVPLEIDRNDPVQSESNEKAQDAIPNEINGNNDNKDKPKVNGNKLYVEKTDPNNIFTKQKVTPDEENTLYELTINDNGQDATFAIYKSSSLKDKILKNSDTVSRDCDIEGDGRSDFNVIPGNATLEETSGLWKLKDKAKIIFF